MHSSFKVVDLFAGPGGLAEGFWSYVADDGRRPFYIELSIEKEPSAFRTLRLRSFLRQFHGDFPPEYYQTCAGTRSVESLYGLYPSQLRLAERETLCLELGGVGAERIIDPLLDEIGHEGLSRTILIGGPPCQPYSLVGRARNRGIVGYLAHEDHRHFLYREYIRILGHLRPIAFVMENVKGILSARVEEQLIFQRILKDLRCAGGERDSYVIIPLGLSGASNSPHVLRSEDFGVPQHRHRVILLGLRADVAPDSEEHAETILRRANHQADVRSVLGDMPRLRSGLSKTKDGPEEWRSAVVTAFRMAADESEGTEKLRVVAKRLRTHAEVLKTARKLSPRSSSEAGGITDPGLATFLRDYQLTAVPNNETRSHMESDLARYAFAAVFAEKLGRSPKAHEFPGALAARHRNWSSGKFADRFRVQRWDAPSSTITSHISKDGHYFIHPDPEQCRSLTVREAARLQTFPDNYLFLGNRTQQFTQVGNAVPPYLARQIAAAVHAMLTRAPD
jgi:DNA (cytosine-5)-methyltransferase 1